jgi:predicted kinase
MVGIPSSGKSTWASRNLPGCPIVSTDDIREELFGTAEFSGGQKKVFDTAHARVAQAIRDGEDVVYDATNTRPKYRKALLDKLRAEGLDFQAIAVVMQAAPPHAITLQKGRSRKVPPGVIWHFHRTFVPPTPSEGFAEIRYVAAVPV